MKLLLLFTVVVAVAVGVPLDNVDKNIDVEAIVSNNDTLKSYYGCFVGLSPCDDVQTALKKDIGEAISEACSKCTPTEKHNLRRFLEVLKQKYQQDYEDLKKKFDPETKFFPNLEAVISDA